jgi:hypothetical protein
MALRAHRAQGAEAEGGIVAFLVLDVIGNRIRLSTRVFGKTTHTRMLSTMQTTI